MNPNEPLTTAKIKSIIKRQKKAASSLSCMGGMLLELELESMTPEQRQQIADAMKAGI